MEIVLKLYIIFEFIYYIFFLSFFCFRFDNDFLSIFMVLILNVFSLFLDIV